MMHEFSKVAMNLCPTLKDVPPLIIPFEIELGENWYDTTPFEIAA